MKTRTITNFEPKINLTLARPNITQDQLFDAGVMLSSLNSKFSIVHRYDADIEMLIENENETAPESETNLLFDENVNVIYLLAAKHS